MIKRDYHGFTVESALADLSYTISLVRQNRKIEDAEFITGHGIIAERIMNALRYTYKLTPSIQIGNSGVIICIIE